jgi:hypothetical protein
MHWIIILFVIYLDAFKVEKNGGIILQGHFSGRPQFGKFGFKTFWSHFEALNDVFLGSGVKNLSTTPFMVFYTLRYFQRCKSFINWSLYEKVKSLAS